MIETSIGGQMSRNEANKKMYWAVMFDLSCEKLRELHPAHNDTTAYYELGAFFHRNGFKHQQGSVYTTRIKVTASDVYGVMDKLYEAFPWIYPCSKDIRLTGFENVVKANIREHFRRMHDHDMETAGCNMDYINMHSEDYDISTQKEEELDIVEEEVKRKQTLKEALMGRVLKRKEVTEKEQKKETAEWKLIL